MTRVDSSVTSRWHYVHMVTRLMLLSVLLWEPSCHSHSWCGYLCRVLVWVTTGLRWRTPWPDWGESYYTMYAWQPGVGQIPPHPPPVCVCGVTPDKHWRRDGEEDTDIFLPQTRMSMCFYKNSEACLQPVVSNYPIVDKTDIKWVITLTITGRRVGAVLSSENVL